MHRMRTPLLLWASLLLSVRDSNAGPLMKEWCSQGFCVTLDEGEITSEAGLCVVVPCSFNIPYYFTPQHLVWYKCPANKQRCSDSDKILHTNKNNVKVQAGFKGRVTLLESDLLQRNCSIMVNDLTESDSGEYQLKVNRQRDGWTFSPRVTVSVKALSQKPTVRVPPLTEGQQTTLTCTAPGLCSGSPPTITWMWKPTGDRESHLAGNVTDLVTEEMSDFTQRHVSTLTFKASSEHHHHTNVTCVVNFTGNVTTEETVTLTVIFPVPPSVVLPWVLAGISLTINVFATIFMMLLWNSRRKATPNQEDRTYMSLKKRECSPDYDVIARHPGSSSIFEGSC